MKPFFRKLHRWLGLLMALQITAWMASGLYFAIFPIETIRGEHLTEPEGPPQAGALAGLIPPAEAWSSATGDMAGPLTLSRLELVQRFGATWYRVAGLAGGEPFARLVDASDGRRLARLDEAAVRELAEAALAVPGRIESAELLHAAPPGSEIRGRQLPVWKIAYREPESLALYFDPWTGDLLARRTTRWRIFDFLWMLHIMDFETRDDFNSPLLQGAALLGLLVALSGVIFWAMTSRVFRSRRRLRG